MGWLSNALNFDVASTLNIPHIVVQAVIFLIAMYVANMFFQGEKSKLLWVALVAAGLIYFLV